MYRRVVFVAEYSKYNNEWIEKELKSSNENYIFIYNEDFNPNDYKKKMGRFVYWSKYIKLAFKVLNCTDENDVIIGLTFTVGLVISLLAKIRGENRKVISLNLIAYDNSKLDFIKVPLFRYAFLKNGLISTVNSNEYAEHFNMKFKLGNKKVFYILNDPINERFINNFKIICEEDYCFSGGEANRDWKTFYEVAERCNKIKFNLIARKKNWENIKKTPPNLQLKFDTDMEEFIEELSKSKIVLITLKDNMVSGLTVFIQAMAMKKFVLITDTPATRVYVPKECEKILIQKGNVDEIVGKINYFSNNKDERNYLVDMLYQNLINEFSKEKYVMRILNIAKEQFSNSLS